MNDYSATLWPTPRAERASEMIQEKIEAGEKLTHDYMMTIQHDFVDTNARRETPWIIKTAEKVKGDYTEEE